MSDQLTEEQFCDRFVKHMVSIAGGTRFHDGESVVLYAESVAPSYYEADWQREEGPEACAEADKAEWEWA